VPKKPQHLSSKPARNSRDHAQIIVNAYREAFGKHYPHHTLEFRAGKTRDGEPGYYVLIGADKGDRALSLQDMKEATAAFLH
jgi:hypothetical protein